MVARQKGLMSGTVDKNNEIMESNIQTTANYRDLATTAGLKQMGVDSKNNFKNITRSSEDVMAALKANKANIQTAIILKMDFLVLAREFQCCRV